jgi:ribosomal protein S18 acetylase RimI-like enzyme
LSYSNIEFVTVESSEQIELLARLADEIWHEHFPGIITYEQVDYMVEKFQSAPAITKQIAEGGYTYNLIYSGGVLSGYTGYVKEESKLFLSKLYVKKEMRGRSIASEAFDLLEGICRENGLRAVYLTVNKNNQTTIDIYKHKGFFVREEKCADIGNGMVMDDYVMEKIIR